MRKKRVRNELYFENVLPWYSADEFRADSFLNVTAYCVCSRKSLVLPRGLPHLREDWELRRLWILGNPECLRSVAD